MFTLSTLTTIRGSDLKWRLIRTLALFLPYFLHGAFLGAIGPTMMDLQIRTGSTITQVGYLTMARALGGSVGSFLGGPIATKIDIQTCISVSLFISSIAVGIFPWPTDINTTIGVVSIAGIGYGIIETCLYLNMIYLWGSECEPFIQMLHFSWGLGGTISPLIAREFLLPRNESNSDQWSSGDVNIHWCYELIAVIGAIGSALFLLLRLYAPISGEHPSRKIDIKGMESNVGVSKLDENNIAKGKYVRIFCIALCCLYIIIYTGSENQYGMYISPYATYGVLSMSKYESALMASVFYCILTFTKLISIVYTKYIGSLNNLFLCSFVMLITNIFLIPFKNNATCLWVASVLFGFGTSSVFGSLISYMETTIKITPLITSLTIVSDCVGTFTFLTVTSLLFDTNHEVFLWVTLGTSVTMAIVLILIVISFNYYAKISTNKQ